MRGSPWSRRRSNRSPLATLGVVLAVAIIAALSVLLQPPAPALVGRAVAVDGDTLRIGSTRVRLVGLDAPELDQTCRDPSETEWPCGREAKQFLAGVLGMGAVECARRGRDRYGRTLATCVTSGKDIGLALVDAGWAVAELDYAVPELAARAAGRGIWVGKFENPADFRRDHGAEPFELFTWIWSWFG